MAKKSKKKNAGRPGEYENKDRSGAPGDAGENKSDCPTDRKNENF